MYYPKSKIKTGLYTNGGEYVEKLTGKEYKGDYYKTIDNKFYTGKEPSQSSVEIIFSKNAKITNKSVVPSMYSFIKNVENGNKTFPIPTPEKPIPTESDYNNGFLERYFMKRINGGPETIKEISNTGYKDASKNPLYQAVSLKWKLTGPLKDKDTNPYMPIYGIEDTNRRSVESAEKQMKGISQYLRNLTEFARISQ